jgi:hypothetical protein
MSIASIFIGARSARPGHDEEAPERKQGAPVPAGRVGAGHQLGVARLEAAPRRLLEGVEQGPEPGALGPLLDRIGALEDLEILGLPDVERGRVGRERVIVEVGIGHRGRPEQGLERRAPRPAARGLRDERVRGRPEVARHLDGQHARRREGPEQPREQPLVAGEPEERGIGVDEIGRPRRAPGGQVRLLPGDRGGGGRGPGQHGRRIVDAGDARLGPALLDEPRDIARAGAQVVYLIRALQRDAVEQVDRGAQPVVRELQVLRGIPGHAT